jgi:hypothetical protein
MNSAVEIIEKAVEDAKEYQAHQTFNREGMKLMNIVKRFLQDRKRLLYGGYAINALLPKKDQFYDATKELPDFDFLTPDPFTDIAELIQRFTEAGYEEIEPVLGIHKGTVKIFVNFQGVADITYCDPVVYEVLKEESIMVDRLAISSPNYLRMNMFAELSHPAGDISRWPKVYKRLLLLNKAHPFRECKPQEEVGAYISLSGLQKEKLYSAMLKQTSTQGDILLGVSDMQTMFQNPFQTRRRRFKAVKQAIQDHPFLVFALSNTPLESAKQLQKSWSKVLNSLELREVNAVGELLPGRVELVYQDVPLYIVFQTEGCHAYYSVPIGRRKIRIGSMDTLLHFYFAFFYGRLKQPGQHAILCLCKELLELADAVRVKQTQAWPFPLFAVECLGYQPTLADLKREHRKRVKEERERKQAEQKLRRSIKSASARLQKSKYKTRKFRK